MCKLKKEKKAMKNPTKKSRFESLLKLIVVSVDNDVEGFDFDDLTEFCENEIQHLDSKAIKAKERAAEKRAAGDEIRGWARDALTDTPQTRAELLAAIQETYPDNEFVQNELTSNKLVSRLTALIEDGYAVKETMVVGETGAKHKVTVYSLANE